MEITGQRGVCGQKVRSSNETQESERYSEEIQEAEAMMGRFERYIGVFSSGPNHSSGSLWFS